MRVALVVHGGAGTFQDDRHTEALDGCRQALEVGADLLQSGASAIDTVETVVRILEDNPMYDAGHGSYPNSEGEIEMDAILVDGETLRFGAVAALRNTANPVSVARRVMDATPHCLIVGEGADRFARAQGFPFVPTAELLCEHPTPETGKGTVGAVALDGDGHIAAATSTGGMRNKMPGRVGDSPIIGCGAIAHDSIGGVSATGHGEHMMRIMISSRVLHMLESGVSVTEATQQAVSDLKHITGGTGGVICLDASGQIGIAFNTIHMAHGFMNIDGHIKTSLI